MWTVNFQMFKLVVEKAEEPQIKLPTSAGSSKKQESPKKNIYFFFIDYAKAFDYVDHSKLWKIIQEMGIADHLTCLLRNLYAGQEETVRIGHGPTDWFQIGKGVHQGCMLSPCLFNLYAEYITRNTGLEEAQAGIKTAGRNINNLIYAEDTTLMEESKEELKSLLMKVKEESEKAELKLNIQKTKKMASGPITSCEIDGETVETVRDFILGGSNITVDGDCSHEIKRCLLLGRKVLTNLVQFSSVSQSCPTFCNPVNHSTPGLPVHHQRPESTQTHVHWVGDPTNHLILCHPLILLISIFSSIRVFSNEL